MEVKEFFHNDYKDIILEHIKNKQEDFYYGVLQKTVVLCCNRNFINSEFCEDNQIEVFDVPNVGSSIVSFKGDVDIAHFSLKDNMFYKDFSLALIELLKQKGVSAIIDNNDVLVDEKYKVCACAKILIGDIFYTGIHVSVNVDRNLINNICLKKAQKIPQGLSAYGISSQDVVNMIIGLKGGKNAK